VIEVVGVLAIHRVAIVDCAPLRSLLLHFLRCLVTVVSSLKVSHIQNFEIV
jgi:hypothetical protein